MNEFKEWGKWARHNPCRLGYPAVWLEQVMRDNVPSKSPNYTITDDEALAIDKAVCALARHSLLQYQIFCLYYLAGLSVRQIAKIADERILHNRRNRVKQELDKATAFVLGYQAR